MTKIRGRRITPGDVFELSTNSGYVALQVIGKHKTLGWAVRVTEPSRREPMQSAVGIETGQEAYVVLMGDIGYEEVLRHVRYVGKEPLPTRYRGHFPTFRASSSYGPDGRHKPGSWWLDDGDREWRVGDLSEEEKHYPYRQLTPAIALKDLIERGWDPEWEFKGPESTEFTRVVPVSQEVVSREVIPSVFCLVFPNRQCALLAYEYLQHEKIFRSVELDEVGDGVRWLVEAHVTDDSCDMVSIEALLLRVAREYGGDYDGNELPIE